MTYEAADTAKLEAKHERERVDLALVSTIEAQDLPRITEAAVEGVEISKVHAHCYAADATIVLTAPTLQDALVTAEKLDPLHLMRVKDGSLSFVPMDFITLKQQESESAHITDIGPWAYTVNGLREHSEEHTLFFFIDGGRLGERTLRIEIQVAQDTGTYRCWDVHHSYGETIVDNCRLQMDHAHWTEADKFWSSNDQPSRYVCY